jgi:hypothetical protein
MMENLLGRWGEERGRRESEACTTNTLRNIFRSKNG